MMQKVLILMNHLRLSSFPYLAVIAVVGLSCRNTPAEPPGYAPPLRLPFRIVHNHSTGVAQGSGVYFLDTLTQDHLVVNGFASILYPSWSPDGTKIVFQGTKYTTSEIHIVNIDGSGEHIVPPNPDRDEHPIWSPDGRHILFESWRSTVDLWVVDSSGSGLYDLTPFVGRDYEGAFSPDGQNVAYIGHRTGDNDLYVTDLAGTSHLDLTNTPTVNEYYPAWSPDGSRIVYWANKQLWTVAPDGTDRRQLTYLQDSVLASPPQFSPDGRTILIETASGGICRVNADGTGFVALTQDDPALYKSAHWSPRGDAIVFNSARLGDSQIFLMDKDGLTIRQLTNTLGDNAMPAWAPR